MNPAIMNNEAVDLSSLNTIEGLKSQLIAKDLPSHPEVKLNNGRRSLKIGEHRELAEDHLDQLRLQMVDNTLNLFEDDSDAYVIDAGTEKRYHNMGVVESLRDEATDIVDSQLEIIDPHGKEPLTAQKLESAKRAAFLTLQGKYDPELYEGLGPLVKVAVNEYWNAFNDLNDAGELFPPDSSEHLYN